jgi:hypothetical protein
MRKSGYGPVRIYKVIYFAFSQKYMEKTTHKNTRLDNIKMYQRKK